MCVTKPYFVSKRRDFVLYCGDCRKVVSSLSCKFDMIFADPPYFLSNGGISVQAGKSVCVNKGDWDTSRGYAKDAAFNHEWLKVCREKLADDGTIWVCGTYHNIFLVANALTELDYRILNVVTWQKTNPPPNLSCRFFTHSTEFLVWARKSKKVPHFYDYDLMHELAGNKQMTDVWRMPAIASWEKICGKHPTQKPLALVVRAILSSTKGAARILDPFTGSSTTGIAAGLTGRSFVGIDTDKRFLDMSVARYKLLPSKRVEWTKRIGDLSFIMKSGGFSS